MRRRESTTSRWFLRGALLFGFVVLLVTVSCQSRNGAGPRDPSLPAHDRGLGPWNLGMTRTDAQRFCALIEVDTGELECTAWNSGGRSRRVRLRFAGDVLDRIALWWFEAPQAAGVTRQGLDVLSRLDVLYDMDPVMVKHYRREIAAIRPESLAGGPRGFSAIVGAAGPKLEIVLGAAPPAANFAVKVILAPRPRTHPTYR